MFANEFLAEIIARIFYDADKIVRREMIDAQNPLEINEQDRVSTLCALIRQEVSRNPLISSFSIQAHGRDTTRRDALFVFRYKEEIKIGLVEAKVLRIQGAALNDEWDWYNAANQSHFTQQVIDQQMWLNQAAVWDMFIPNCNVGEHSPPFDREGSSNIWADNLIGNTKITTPNLLWNYQDVLNAAVQYLSLYDIVKAILMCEKGVRHDITGKDELIIVSTNDRITMPIPIPRNPRLNSVVIESFFSKNKTIDSLNYYRFDNLFNAVKDYPKKQFLQVPRFKSADLSQEFLSIVEDSYNSIKNKDRR